MGYGTGCCCSDLINLVKLNAFTGAKIWGVQVPGLGISPQAAGRVEALHGTNDVIVEIGDGSLCRVDSTGSQQWFYSRGFFGSAIGGTRSFGSDGTRIVAANLSGPPVSAGSIYGINYSGSNIWTNTFASGLTTPISVAVGATTNVFGTQLKLVKLNNSTGTTVFSTGSGTQTITAIDSNDDIIDAHEPLNSHVTKLSSATGALLATGAFTQSNTTRFGAAGNSFISSNFSTCSGTNGTSLTQVFSTNTVAGATFSTGVFDTCNGLGTGYATRYYFAGQQQTGSGGVIFNIFCLDGSGSPVWVQRYSSGNPGLDTVQGLCLSDDGYLYAAGGLTPR